MDKSKKSLVDAYEKFPDAPEHYREAALDASLRQLFLAAVNHAQERIAWYSEKAQERSKVAKGIRWWSLFLFAVGTLAPIFLVFLLKLAAVAEQWKEPPTWDWLQWIASIPLAEVGYVLLALAGALVIFDQFFDASGSWMRFRQSEARLRVLLAELRFTWAELLTKHRGNVAIPQAAFEFVKPLREFVSKVELLAEEETKEWSRRFNERIEAFDRNPNLKIRFETDAKTSGPAASANEPPQTEAKKSSPTIDNTTLDSEVVTGLDTVTVRLAINDSATLDNESLALKVNETIVPIKPEGLIELPLEVGHTHRIVATARRTGQAVRGELQINPNLDDDHKALALDLT